MEPERDRGKKKSWKTTKRKTCMHLKCGNDRSFQLGERYPGISNELHFNVLSGFHGPTEWHLERVALHIFKSPECFCRIVHCRSKVSSVMQCNIFGLSTFLCRQ
ncbi:hypothetical protein CDAR_76041 [Caerostris darwini]|uniref:Uncharacterized protein n=1 Tax=Caerostris darwini TaxID=1538125 RepID=A0AAV4Q6S3_9ARAC|nr:hypothetical protein CDAR_76041 [Caerostris darwini]